MAPTAIPDFAGMTDRQAEAAVARMTLRELAPKSDMNPGGMTLEQVEALPPKARELRRTRLRQDPTSWGIAQIADAAGLGRGAVSAWRGNYLRTGQESAEALLAPDPDLSDPNIKQPGDTSPARGGTPRWRAGDARDWLHGAGRRLTQDYFPTGGRKPPGRPPTQRDPADLADSVAA